MITWTFRSLALHSFSLKEEVNRKPALNPRKYFERFKDTTAIHTWMQRSKMQLICKSTILPQKCIVATYLADAFGLLIALCRRLRFSMTWILLSIVHYVVFLFFLNKQIPGVFPASAGETSTLGARLRPALRCW